MLPRAVIVAEKQDGVSHPHAERYLGEVFTLGATLVPFAAAGFRRLTALEGR